MKRIFIIFIMCLISTITFAHKNIFVAKTKVSKIEVIVIGHKNDTVKVTRVGKIYLIKIADLNLDLAYLNELDNNKVLAKTIYKNGIDISNASINKPAEDIIYSDYILDTLSIKH